MNIDQAKALNSQSRVRVDEPDRGRPDVGVVSVNPNAKVHTNLHGKKFVWVSVEFKEPGRPWFSQIWPSTRLTRV